MSWLTRCWRTHGAAKVVRLHGLELPAQAAPPGLRVLLLLRQPAEVVASRLSLEAFSRQSAFNPRGGPAGVVSAVCAGMPNPSPNPNPNPYPSPNANPHPHPHPNP